MSRSPTLPEGTANSDKSNPPSVAAISPLRHADARLPEDPPGVAPAALPERPEQLPARVGERALLARLLYAQVDMPPAEVAPLAGGKRLDGERFSTRAAEAMVAEVGDGGQLGIWSCW